MIKSARSSALKSALLLFLGHFSLFISFFNYCTRARDPAAMELEHLGGGGGKPEKSNTRLYKIALAIGACVCAVLLLALIVGKSHAHAQPRRSHTGDAGVPKCPCGDYFWGR